MSHILEMLGRGLLANLWSAFPGTLTSDPQAPAEELAARVRSSPDDVRLSTSWGVALLNEQRPVEARNVFKEVVERAPEDLIATLGLACALAELDRHEDAIGALQQARPRDAANPAIPFCLGYCHELLRHPEDAVRCYQEALELCPGLKNAHERLAAIYLARDELKPAIMHYQRLAEWEPRQAEYFLALGHLMLRGGRFEEAVERFEHALALEPDNWAAHDDMVSAYEQAGQYDEAIDHLQEMIEREPGFVDTYVRLGDMYAAIGDDDASLEQYLRAVEIHPEYLEAAVKIGTQHLRCGRYDDASRWFTLAMETNDRLLTAYVGLATAQEAAGRRLESRTTYEMAASIEPNSTLLFSEMARMQLKAAVGRQAEHYLSIAVDDPEPDAGAPEDLLDEQIERHRTALKESPRHADLHYRMGLLLRHRGDYDAAIEAFETALEINPAFVTAMIKLGLALYEKGDTDRAIGVLRRAVEIEPEYVDLHYQLGLSFAKRQQFDLAVEHFEHAVRGNSQNAEFHANLALALQQLGLIDRARACWEAVRSLAPESELADHFLKNRFGESDGLSY
ncbi:MAG: tetratricopeptide repeat protein [Phycisphaerae bacterium]